MWSLLPNSYRLVKRQLLWNDRQQRLLLERNPQEGQVYGTELIFSQHFSFVDRRRRRRLWLSRGVSGRRSATANRTVRARRGETEIHQLQRAVVIRFAIALGVDLRRRWWCWCQLTGVPNENFWRFDRVHIDRRFDTQLLLLQCIRAETWSRWKLFNDCTVSSLYFEDSISRYLYWLPKKAVPNTAINLRHFNIRLIESFQNNFFSILIGHTKVTGRILKKYKSVS